MKSSNVVAIHNSDIDSPSSVDCRDSDDCNSSVTSDSDSRYYITADAIVATHAGAHACHPDSWISASDATAKDYANAI